MLLEQFLGEGDIVTPLLSAPYWGTPQMIPLVGAKIVFALEAGLAH
jgi:hypothetical protein